MVEATFWQFSGFYADIAEKHLQMMRIEGFSKKTISNSRYVIFKFLDFLSSESKDQTSITREIVIRWARKSENESISTHNNRIGALRKFCRRLISWGYPCWDPSYDAGLLMRRVKYVPFIFTQEQLKELLLHVDALPHKKAYPFSHLSYQIAFRLLIFYGLRLGEVEALTCQDINFNARTIRIINSKSKQPRFLPIKGDLLRRLEVFNVLVHSQSNENTPLLLIAPTCRLHSNSIYTTFRSILRKMGISHRGKGKGPRVHDLRHSFVIHKISSWQSQGKDLNLMLPFLATFLGHNSYLETAYYFKLIAALDFQIREKEEAKFQNIIPQARVPSHDFN